MQATKRERIILYGAVPIAAAIIGAIVTAVLTQRSGGPNTAAAIAQITADKALTAAQKLRALELVNKNDQQLYDLIRTCLLALVLPLGAIAYAVADWIRSR